MTETPEELLARISRAPITEAVAWANGKVLANIKNGTTPVLNANKVGFFDTPLYTRPIGETGDADELTERNMLAAGRLHENGVLGSGYVETLLRDNAGALTSLRAERDAAVAANNAHALEYEVAMAEAESSLAAEKQRNAELERENSDLLTVIAGKPPSALEQRVVELTAERDALEAKVTEREQQICNLIGVTTGDLS